MTKRSVWRPGTRLLQHEYAHDPWKMIVVCILLNQTTNTQVRPVLPELFKRYPNAMVMSGANTTQLADLIRPLGLQNRRAETLVKFSKAYVKGHPIEKCFGVGKYAYDSYKLFVLRDLDVEPTDKELVAYMAWRKSMLNRKDKHAARSDGDAVDRGRLQRGEPGGL